MVSLRGGIVISDTTDQTKNSLTTTRWKDKFLRNTIAQVVTAVSIILYE